MEKVDYVIYAHGFFFAVIFFLLCSALISDKNRESD
jgi:hypothetical protein